MKKPYWGLWALLFVSLVIFAFLSLWQDGINLGGWEIKTTSFARDLGVKTSFQSPAPAITTSDDEAESKTETSTKDKADSSVKEKADAGAKDKVDAGTKGTTGKTDAVAKGNADALARGKADVDALMPHEQHLAGWRAPMDTTAKNILFIGDSMLEGLAPRLAAYCEKNGHTLIEVIWYSSSTLCWGKTARLTELINKYHPNYIMVCLGANELFVPDIKHARRPYLRKMLAEIGNIPYVWIGPPNWVEDTGINDLLAQELDEGCFYLSANDHFERSRDGAHPKRSSAHLWMDRVVKWMETKGAHPIRLEKPKPGISRANRLIIYQPPK